MVTRILKEAREKLHVPRRWHKTLYIFFFHCYFFLFPRFIFQTIPLVLHFRDIRGQISCSGVIQGPNTNLFKSFYGENAG